MIARFSLAAGVCALALVGCGPQTTDTADTKAPTTETVFANVTEDRIRSAVSDPGEWPSYGLTYDEQRFSPLDAVNRDTVKELGIAWSYDLSTGRGVESTPIVVDGTMYVTSAWSVVHALDAKTGEELWVYDPGVDRARGVAACCDVVNRGVAVWKGKVYVGTIDGRLVALDAKTGDVSWDVITVDQSQPYTITGAPRVVKGRVLIGNGGAELGVRGYVSAYDAATGEMNWRFYTTPNATKAPDGAISDKAFEEVANITWGSPQEGQWDEIGGGGTVWDSIIYDPDLNLIYIGVGNGSPWNQQLRDPSGGDNLFLSSIVALDADTGAYKWHFQTTPGDTWDYTATQHMMLANLPLGEDGADRRVLMQAPKNGFFYVLDAETGEFISGEPFVALNWATGLDENGRPVEVPEARYVDGGFLQIPAPLGAHNWHPMAMHPDEGLVYIPAQEMAQLYATDPDFEIEPGFWNLGVEMDPNLPATDAGIMKAIKASMTGSLLAWDPVKQEARWEVEHGMPWNGGVLATAGGLVFQGRMDGKFAAYDAATGEELWSSNVQSGALSGPATYKIDGEQYVTITTGWGTAFVLTAGFAVPDGERPDVGKVVTFRIGGDQTLPDVDLPQIAKVPAAEPFGDAALLAAGQEHYHQHCQVCHGPAVISGGALPDLRWSMIAGNKDAWRAVLQDGSLSDIGMVSFAPVLSDDQTEAIRAYVLARAHEDVAAATGGQP